MICVTVAKLETAFLSVRTDFLANYSTVGRDYEDICGGNVTRL